MIFLWDVSTSRQYLTDMCVYVSVAAMNDCNIEHSMPLTNGIAHRLALDHST